MSKDKPKEPPEKLSKEEAEKLADKVIWKPGKGPRDQPSKENK